VTHPVPASVGTGQRPSPKGTSGARRVTTHVQLGTCVVLVLVLVEARAPG